MGSVADEPYEPLRGFDRALRLGVGHLRPAREEDRDSWLDYVLMPLSAKPGEPVTAWLSGGWVVPVIVATAGNTLGACTTYWLARAAVAVAPPSGERTRRASVLLARYGPPAMLLSWVPLVGDVLVLLAGGARMPVPRFVAWTLVGKCARYVAVALAVDVFTGDAS